MGDGRGRVAVSVRAWRPVRRGRARAHCGDLDGLAVIYAIALVLAAIPIGTVAYSIYLMRSGS